MKLKTIARFILTLTILVPVYAQNSPADGGEIRDRSRVGAPALVGSWVLDVRLIVSPPFQAMQTFHATGTMNETSDLLANLGEGPGHGAWERDGEEYTATFELFIFNPDRSPAGRIRVRESLRITGPDTLAGYTVADLILPDGTVIENIDSGPATGTRVRVAPVRPEEQLSGPTNAAFARRYW
jgi:hypothetical protein